MSQQRHPFIYVLILVCLLPVLPRMADAQNQNYVDLSAGRIQGDFGTTVNSSLNSVTAVFGHFFGNKEVDNKTLGNLEASVSLSYLDLSTEGLSNETGIGDVILKAGGNIKHNEFTFYPSVSIKFPTADENKQLGSGETDVGGFLSLTHPCAAFVCGLDLGYILMGDPPGTDYNNIAHFNFNVFRRFGRLGAGAFVQQDSALLDGAEDPRSMGINAFYLFPPKFAVYTEFNAGLNDAAADSSFRLGMVQWF